MHAWGRIYMSDSVRAAATVNSGTWFEYHLNRSLKGLINPIVYVALNISRNPAKENCVKCIVLW
jgi:hypothetical protein